MSGPKEAFTAADPDRTPSSCEALERFKFKKHCYVYSKRRESS